MKILATFDARDYEGTTGIYEKYSIRAIIVRDGRLAMQCSREGEYKIPGGGQEPGENYEQTLIRECREELAISITVGEIFMDVTHAYPDMTVHLTLFHAAITGGTPKLLEHQDLKWVTADEIQNYEFCPADAEILERIKNI